MTYNDFERWISQKIINVSYRNLVRLLIDTIILALAYYLAFDIRLDFSIDEQYYLLMKKSVIFVVPISILSMIAFRNYQKFWRFFSGKDTVALLIALSVSGGLLLVFPNIFNETPIPRSVIVIYNILGFLLLIGVRSLYRYMIASFVICPSQPCFSTLPGTEPHLFVSKLPSPESQGAGGKGLALKLQAGSSLCSAGRHRV